jgi:hypothetical protein
MWRSDTLALPPFVAKNGADALWALMVFLMIALIYPSWTTLTVAAWSAIVSCAIEFSQLYHAPWIDAVRSTMLGHLILGDTIAWSDIAAYLFGVVLAVSAEYLVDSIKRSKGIGPTC